MLLISIKAWTREESEKGRDEVQSRVQSQASGQRAGKDAAEGSVHSSASIVEQSGTAWPPCYPLLGVEGFTPGLIGPWRRVPWPRGTQALQARTSAGPCDGALSESHQAWALCRSRSHLSLLHPKRRHSGLVTRGAISPQSPCPVTSTMAYGCSCVRMYCMYGWLFIGPLFPTCRVPWAVHLIISSRTFFALKLVARCDSLFILF